MTDVPIQSFHSAIELFEAQVRDELGRKLVTDVLAPMSDEYRSLSELSNQTREDVSALQARLESNRETDIHFPQ